MRFLSSILFVVMGILFLEGCGSRGYQARPNEEVYGNWISTASPPERMIMRQTGLAEGYLFASDEKPFWIFEYKIVSKEKDSEGNIKYRMNYKMTHPSDAKKMEIGKISNNGTIWEFVNIDVADFRTDQYPKQIDPKNTSYHRYRLAQ
jgi:hypothetical protein